MNADSLTLCEQEPIHLLSNIQAHGVLLVLSEPELIVLQVSNNIEAILGCRISQVLKQPLSNIVEPQALAAVSASLDSLQDVEQSKVVEALSLELKVHGQMQSFHGSLHRSHFNLLLELEPDTIFTTPDSASRSLYWHYQQIKTITLQLQKNRNLADLQTLAVLKIQQLTGFDRVMMYQFAPDWSGHVVAEAKVPSARSFLDLHFPASDIPAQARELYRHNWLRGIADIDCAPAQIVPTLNPHTNAPVDLSHAVLRSVSPVHIEYLRNMQVHASFSISILKEDQLWGLIACHHSEAKYIDYPTRTVCEVVGQVLSIQIALCENLALYEKILRLEADKLRLDDILKVATGMNPQRSPETWQRLQRMVLADGVMVQFKHKRHVSGITPSETQLDALLQWLQQNQFSYLFFTDHLQSHYPAAADFTAQAAGIVSLHIDRTDLQYIIWFRQEVIRTVHWAGDPNAAHTVTEARVSPRQSFASWCSTMCGHAQTWEIHELENAMSLYELHNVEDEFWPLNEQS